MTPQVRDVLDLHPVVGHNLPERVLRDLASHGHGDRSAADDVAHLTLVRVTAAVGALVTHGYEVSACAALALSFDLPRERVRRVRGSVFGLATATFRGTPHPVGLRVEPVHERDPDLRRQREAAADHPEVVAPMPHRPPTALLRVQPLDRNRPHPLIPRRVAQHAQTRPARHIQQARLRARHRRLGTRDLPRLRDRHFASDQRVAGLRTRLDRRHQRQRVTRIASSRTRHTRQPITRIREPQLAMHTTRRRPSREPRLGRLTRLARRRQLLNDSTQSRPEYAPGSDPANNLSNCTAAALAPPSQTPSQGATRQTTKPRRGLQRRPSKRLTEPPPS